MTLTRHKIGVVIPAHNEQDHIGACLHAIQRAITTLQQEHDVDVGVVVVLDDCSDLTAERVAQTGIATLSCQVRNVGQARALGITQVMNWGAEWLACTDADSCVDADWLLAQYRHWQQEQLAMICGVVYVADWGTLSADVQRDYLAHYRDQMGHRHIHGANLAFSAQAYQQVGGFSALPCHEDVDLVKRFVAAQLPICWSNQVRVATSSRLEARAPEGFAHFLTQLTG